MSDYVELGKRINRNALEDAWQHERARADAVEAELVEARERLRQIEAGADPTPRDEAAWPTRGQAWHELLNMTEGVRLRRLGDLLMAAGSVMGLTISRDFQADMAAGWKARAETAEAELADARERLRRCEERLAAVEVLAENWDHPDAPCHGLPDRVGEGASWHLGWEAP